MSRRFTDIEKPYDLHYTVQVKILHFYLKEISSCADPELENHKAIGFLINTCLDPLNYNGQAKCHLNGVALVGR